MGRPNMTHASAIVEEVSDSRLLTILQRRLDQSKYRNELSNIRLCGSQATRAPHWSPAVFVMSNKKHSRLFGVNTCHSSWACPRCTAKTMARYGQRIACAIDALAKQQQYAVMITFTLPHDLHMSASEAFEVLRNTWTKFSHAGNHKGTKRTYVTKKTGETKVYYIGNKVYGRFRQDLGITHNVRVFEFTYGKNGWHPHIHALFWVPKKNLSRLLSYEDELLDHWWSLAKVQALKMLNKKSPLTPELNQATVNQLYDDIKKAPGYHKSVYISRDEHGRPRIQKSSYYISGWSGDYELTANLKTARPGHYTPYQLLAKAHDLLRYKQHEEANKFIDLYIEYALATKGFKRVHFSARSGINDIVKDWMQSNEYYMSLKKKVTDRGVDKWKVVVWFTPLQWSEIFLLNKTEMLIPKVLALSHQPNAKRLITDMLLQYGVDISQNKKHYFESFVENRIFENRVATA